MSQPLVQFLLLYFIQKFQDIMLTYYNSNIAHKNAGFIIFHSRTFMH